MPSYEFVCRECGERFSTIIPYSKKKDTRCPRCKSQELKEVFGLGYVSSGGGGSLPATGCG
ncbi:MAG: zinc ribbon domain-containing protein [Firmicutes bacterium]|nr:zinc ribbon domain-containing protein [Bacillota bacterium]